MLDRQQDEQDGTNKQDSTIGEAREGKQDEGDKRDIGTEDNDVSR